MRGQGYEHVYATTETLRDWVVNNESLIMNFYKQLENIDNETK